MVAFDPTRGASSTDRDRELGRQIANALTLVLPASGAVPIVQDALHDADHANKLELARSVIKPAMQRFLWLRWTQRLRLANPDDERKPVVGPQTRVSCNGALALAFHIAAGLDQDEISDLFSTSPENAGQMLFSARRSLLELPNTCHRPPKALLGCYKSPSLDLSERMELRQHLRGCASCADLISKFEALDGELLTTMDNADVTASSRTTRDFSVVPHSNWLTPVAGVVIVLALFLGVGGPILGVDRIFGGNSSPVRLIPEAQSTGMHGWLVSSTVDGIAAMNLATGEHQMILHAEPDGSQPPVIMMSPSGDRVAFWRFHEDHRITTSVDIVSIEGEHLQTWRWDRSSSPGQVSSWLSEDELLFIRVPGQQAQEPTEHFLDRVSNDTELLALNVFTGKQRTLFTGSVAATIPSPDRKHIAILSSYNRFTAELPGRTLEIRRLSDGVVGNAVVVEQDRLPLQSARPIWGNDSSALYFARLTDDSMGTPSDSHRDERADIARATIRGEVEIVSQNVDRLRIRFLGVSPDEREILFLQANSGPGPVTWDLLRVQLETGETATLTSKIAYPFFFASSAVWLPDGKTAIVSDASTHFIHAKSTTRSVQAGATRFLTVTENEPVQAIATEMGIWGVDAWGEPTLRWFPEDWSGAPSEQEVRQIIGIFSEPEAPEWSALRHSSAQSSVSPTGEYAILEHTSIGVPLVWNMNSSAGRLLAGSPAPSDISWTAGLTSLVGVQSERDDARQIRFFASRSTRVADFFDYRGADPADIETKPTHRYAKPAFSSDGNRLSYFIIDDADGARQLWVSAHGVGHVQVTDWTLPADASIDPPLISAWTSPTTMLASIPASWSDGFPTEIRLVEVQFGSTENNTISTRTLHTFTARGNDHGITVETIDFSPDGELVAIRIRSYASRDLERGARDAILVASSADIKQSIQIATGGPGHGLSWSPDGAWLSFGLDDQILVSRDDGTDLLALSNSEDNGRYPLWLGNGDLFYTVGHEDDPQLMRVLTR